MTDRHHGYIVTLERDLREDDSSEVMASIRRLRGVADVEPVTATPETHFAMARCRFELVQQLLDMLHGKAEGER